MKILIYGLQRSGTNYLKEILLKTKNIKFINGNDRSKFTHKHYRFHNKLDIIPDDKYIPKSNIKSVKEIYDKTNINKIIVIKKNIYSWYDSIIKWAKMCNWKFKKEFNEEYIEEYYLFYKFFENSDVILINYEDLLFEKEKVIELFKKHNIEIKNSFFI